ncbi:hypothetical protein F4777DRAFT_207415 [Nemania sp. FL0916]|nr:hypothetical protein F4777DRAFT_207415 [Nemania sp. FL0916]
MASRSPNLEPAEGREIVFCHSCYHEWYRDEHNGLECPRCQETFTEIVQPGSDPREIYPPAHHLQHDSESDPEESNIEDHLHGPGGLFGQRTTHRSPEPSPFGYRSRTRNTGGSDDIMRRFAEMVGDLSGPSVVGRSGPETLFQDDGPGPRVTFRTFRGPGFTGGVSSFTITTGTSSERPRMSPPGTHTHPMPGGDPIQRIFGELLALDAHPHSRPRDMHSSPDASPGDNDGGAGRPLDFAAALNQLLASIVNPNAVHGDAVYSQEALDRIITNLMEANPQSNAPAPATENAIASLPRKKLDAQMLGPELKGECTICIDEVKVGDEVVVLPCGHWFHEECASLWLKQHNSCPVCRAAIDGAAAGKARNETPNTQSQPRAPGPSSSRSAASERRWNQVQQRREERLDSIRNLGDRPRDRQRGSRDSNSPPPHDSAAQRSPRVRSPSPLSRRSTHGERNRENRGSSGSGPFNWIRDRFSGR